MKFIRRFNESNEESIQDIESNIQDICNDITDDGRFSLKFMDKANFNRTGTVTIVRSLVIALSDVRDYDGFTIKEVEDVLQRIYNYLTIRRYLGSNVLKVGDMDRTATKHVTYDDRLTNLAIFFRE